MKGSKKLLSLLLSVLMVIGMFPVPGASAETRAANETWSGTVAGKTISVDASYTAENPYTIYVTGAVTLANQINLTGGGYVKVYGDSNNPPPADLNKN